MSDNPVSKVRTFQVETRFQQMARRPGGVPRDLAIQQALSQIEGYRNEFVAWIDREVKGLAAASEAIKDDVDAASRLGDLQRRCSQLRDTGTTMGFELVTFIADNLCKVLHATQEGARFDPGIVACHIDAMVVAKQESYRYLRSDQVEEMTRGLQQMLDRAKKKSETAA